MYLILVYLSVEPYASMVPIQFNYDLLDQNSYLFFLVVLCFAIFPTFLLGTILKLRCPTNKNLQLKSCNWDSTVKISVIV